MEQEQINFKRPNSKIGAGLLLIVAGILLLIHKMGIVVIPAWLFSWPVLIIVIGLFVGFQHNFRNIFWIIPVVWGSFALLDRQMPSLNLHNFTGPVALILVGLFFIIRRGNHSQRRNRKSNWLSKDDAYNDDMENGEFIDSTSVFGNAKKVVVSKNFKGADITCFMGGADIDLSQADIQGKAIMDVTAIFGGAKIIVPSNWDVKIETTAAFGGVEDKRRFNGASVDPSKVLVIGGVAIFGGIEIKSY